MAAGDICIFRQNSPHSPAPGRTRELAHRALVLYHVLRLADAAQRPLGIREAAAEIAPRLLHAKQQRAPVGNARARGRIEPVMKRLKLRRRRLDTRAQLADKAGVGGQPAAEHDALHRRKARLKRAHGRSVEQIAVVAHRGAAVRKRVGKHVEIRVAVILVGLHARVHDQLADRVVIIQLQQRGECLRRRLAEPRLDRHRQRTGGKHGVEKPPQQIRLREQTCALFLHRDGVRRAAEVEVHLVVAHISELPRHPEKVLGAVAHELRHDTDTRVVRRLDLAQLARGKRAVRRRREKRRIVAVRRGERLPLRLPEQVAGHALHRRAEILHGHHLIIRP